MDRNISFGTIVATLGSILIACGIAWLIAQNWHAMPAAVKIIVLLMLVSGSYIGAFLLREKGYPGIAKALLVLGALLYTLSIFLIAQIFSTDASLQGFAMLLLLAWVGVVIAAYIFESPVTLFIGLVEFTIWIIMQFAAFAERANEFAFGILALYFLGVGVILYGLHLVHRSWKHSFTRTYLHFTALFILIFTYLLSFQLTLPTLWEDSGASTPLLLLLGFIIIVGIAAFIAGLKLLGSELTKQESLGFLAVIGIILTVILLSLAVRNTVGTCYAQNCYSYSTQDECAGAPEQMDCAWSNSYCQQRSCGTYTDQQQCVGDTGLNCEWYDNSYCSFKTCSNYRNAADCEASDLDCTWTNSSYYGYCSGADQQAYDKQYERQRQLQEQCGKLTSHDACASQETCDWRSGVNFWGGRSQGMPPIMWFAWIWANIVLIIVILAIIWYGTINHDTRLINLGILFFSLMVITRYIGFMIDLWGYMSLALVFITGGGLLLLGGWAIERWRRRLTEQAVTK